jgi:TonB family protein
LPWSGTGVPSPPITPQMEAGVTHVTLQVEGARTFRLQLGSMGPPMKAMRDCTDNLVSSWGLNPAQQATLASYPVPLGSPATWMTSNDYPRTALSRGHNGFVTFRLGIDPRGSVTSCHIQEETQPADFATLTCRLISQRARFSPALDSGGQPVASYYINQVRWVIP